MENKDLDQVWKSLSIEQKRKLIDLVLPDGTIRTANVYTNTSQVNLTESYLLNVPVDIIIEIASYFPRDPESFFNFKQTCKSISTILPDFESKVLDKKSAFKFYMFRFINRLNRYVDPGFYIKTHLVFDEKCRYVDVGYGSSLLCCQVDKYTGLILPWQDKTNPRGSIMDCNPEIAIGHPGHIIAVKDLERKDPSYKTRKAELSKTFKDATEHLKTLKGYKKKRVYLDLWDESTLRKKKYKQ